MVFIRISVTFGLNKKIWNNFMILTLAASPFNLLQSGKNLQGLLFWAAGGRPHGLKVQLLALKFSKVDFPLTHARNAGQITLPAVQHE